MKCKQDNAFTCRERVLVKHDIKSLWLFCKKMRKYNIESKREKQSEYALDA